MLCKKCGFQNTEGTNFCISCGNNLTDIQPQNQMGINQPTEEIETLDFEINERMNNQVAGIPEIMNQEVNQPVPEISGNSVNIQNNVVENTIGVQNNQMPDNNTVQNSFVTSNDAVTSTTVNQPNMQQVSQPVNNYQSSSDDISVVSTIIGIFVKPVKTIKEKISKFEVKHSVIITAVVCAVITILSLVQTMITTAQETSYDWSDFSTKTEWNFENLKELDYFDLIVKNYFYVAVAVVVVAVVYFVGAMIAKKSTKFQQTLGLTALSMLPMTIAIFILSPLLTKLSAIVGLFVLMVGIIYSALIFIFGINEQISFDNEDSKIYYNLACASTIVLIICILLADTINGVDTLTSMF